MKFHRMNERFMLAYAVFVLSFVAGDLLAASRTNGPIGRAELLSRQFMGDPQYVIFRNEDGTTNVVRCILVVEPHSVKTPDGNIESPGYRNKVALVTDDEARKTLWSYWPGKYSQLYDFKLVSGGGQTLLVFVWDWYLGLVEPIETNDLPTPFVDAALAAPHSVDLRNLVGTWAFKNDGKIMDSLRRNLGIERVYFDRDWHVIVRGKGGNLFDIVRDGKTWRYAQETYGVTEPPEPRFFIEANSAECEAGRPILMKFTIQNVTSNDYLIHSEQGWGFDLMVSASQNGTTFRVRPDVPPGADPSGTRAPPFAPVYRFMGRIAAGNQQSILQLIQTRDLRPGHIRFDASINLDIKGSPGVEIALSERQETGNYLILGKQETDQLYKDVERLHNHFGTARAAKLAPIVQKFIRTSATSIDAEYALYAGVLQGVTRDATNQDRNLAKSASQAFLTRFPKSWLRAHVYAALILLHRKEGNVEAAAFVLKEGQALPESYPLFQNLRLLPVVQK